MTPTTKIILQGKVLQMPPFIRLQPWDAGSNDSFYLKTSPKITVYITTKVPYKPNSCKAF